MKYCGNEYQLRFAYPMEFSAGPAKGKQGYLVANGRTELFVSTDNAMDISWVRYGGINMSFLSKNGLTGKTTGFADRFEGGFLYTCGLDNYGSCVPERLMHGSLHLLAAEDVAVTYEDDAVVLSGTVRDTQLFDKDFRRKRTIRVYDGRILLTDELTNNDEETQPYCLLYHSNFGYPMLDAGCTVDIDSLSRAGVTAKAEAHKDLFRDFPEPWEHDEEEVIYHTVREGRATLTNPKLGLRATVRYDCEKLPVLIQWKCPLAGDYALGLEPATSRFDEFKMKTLPAGETETYQIEYTFEEI